MKCINIHELMTTKVKICPATIDKGVNYISHNQKYILLACIFLFDIFTEGKFGHIVGHQRIVEREIITGEY